ncbi:MAG: hypothetical protein IJ524_02115 [Bacteroidales bacterium]|nr:hypothetical protein [Bacteroidales bacterium]
MEEPRKIVKMWYSGEKDKDGLPHGEGALEYLTDESRPPFPQYPDLADYYREVGRMVYKGRFWHGKRDSEGCLMELGLRPCSKHEWYSEGDYDCGHLVHPEHPSGSYREGVCMKAWIDVFDGTWRNDMPFKHKWAWVTPREEDLQLAQLTSKETLEKAFDFTQLT